MSQQTLSTAELHQVFLDALGNHLIAHSDPNEKPLSLQARYPVPSPIRLYLYNATHPPGGRTLGEHKIQLIVPGQNRGDKGNFDFSGDHFVVLAGYAPDTNVFVLWDAFMYPDFSYSRNIQVNPKTIYYAVGGSIGFQQRRIHKQGIETVLTIPPELLPVGLQRRVDETEKRLLGD